MSNAELLQNDIIMTVNIASPFHGMDANNHADFLTDIPNDIHAVAADGVPDADPVSERNERNLQPAALQTENDAEFNPFLPLSILDLFDDWLPDNADNAASGDETMQPVVTPMETDPVQADRPGVEETEQGVAVAETVEGRGQWQHIRYSSMCLYSMMLLMAICPRSRKRRRYEHPDADSEDEPPQEYAIRNITHNIVKMNDDSEVWEVLKTYGFIEFRPNSKVAVTKEGYSFFKRTKKALSSAVMSGEHAAQGKPREFAVDNAMRIFVLRKGRKVSSKERKKYLTNVCNVSAYQEMRNAGWEIEVDISDDCDYAKLSLHSKDVFEEYVTRFNTVLMKVLSSA